MAGSRLGRPNGYLIMVTELQMDVPEVHPEVHLMLIGYRAYLKPATKSGPSYDDMVFDRAI